MNSYDIFGVCFMLAVTGLAVDQGWTDFLIAQAAFALVMYLRVWFKDYKKEQS